MIRIDFEDTYAVTNCDEELMSATFVAELANGEKILLKTSLNFIELNLAFPVFNLIFGPVDEYGAIDIFAKIHHKNKGKLFSTILLFALRFLTRHTTSAVGLDGSTEARTYLYHRIFLSNEVYLKNHCKPIGIDWYVRQLRTGEFERLQSGSYHLRPKFDILSRSRKATDPFRYYLIMKNQFNS